MLPRRFFSSLICRPFCILFGRGLGFWRQFVLSRICFRCLFHDAAWTAGYN
ncbi:MAG: hypothetical protein IKQ60_06090 [Candidatus Methanomethylophilaceae archaeon]|nr:hypothetical protein [Candidatus Methanomethylophilaceae archaeon]